MNFVINGVGLTEQTEEQERADFQEAFTADLIEGLQADQKRIDCKYLYDKRGSALFDEICHLEEYYPTRTEERIIDDNIHEISDLIGTNAAIIEFGAGSLRKIRVLLRAVKDAKAFIPIDISKEHLSVSAEGLAREFPSLKVIPICADYTEPLAPIGGLAGKNKKVAFFPGSTIGNFSKSSAVSFLRNVAEVTGPNGELLIGVDLKKDAAILHRAYNDNQGLTARFNLNVLRHANEVTSSNFDLSAFEHHAFYDDKAGRVEMHLVSQRGQTVRVNDHSFEFARGESIHTEDSYKYSVEEFLDLARAAGFYSFNTWTDPDNLFSIHYLKSSGTKPAL